MDPVTVLVVQHPSDLRGTRLPVRPEGMVLGRDVLRSPTVSRQHARTWWHDGALWLEDCVSSNGTLVNGERIHAAVTLTAGDRVTFGGVECQVVSSTEDVSAPVPVDSPWPTQPLLAKDTETTRYLCAATHLDDDFRDRVIRETIGQPYRAVAPSFGVDTAAVAAHALAARARRLVRDILLLAVLVVTVARWAVQLFPADPRWDSETLRLVVSVLWPDVAVAAGVAVVIGAAEAWVTRYLVLTRQLSNRRYRPAAVRQPVGRRTRDRLARIAASEHGNLVVFRGFNPFVGAGIPVDVWSYAVDISKGRKDGGDRLAPKSFRAVDLHDYLSRVLRQVDLPGLSVTHRSFVNGKDVWQDTRLLPDRRSGPVSSVPEWVVQAMLDEAEPLARTYLCAKVTGWDGQLVVTTYFRAVKLRGSLYVEASVYALFPLRQRFFAVDSVAPRGPVEAALESVVQGLVRSVPLVLGSPLRVGRALSAIARASSTERRQRRFISEGWHFDYGAAVSIREHAAGDDARRRFLLSDSDMFEQVVREMLLRGIVEFLTDHDIDAGQVATFQQTINNGHVYSGNFDNRGSKNAMNSGTVQEKR